MADLEDSECGAFHSTIRVVIPKCGGIWVERSLGKGERVEKNVKGHSLEVAEARTRIKLGTDTDKCVVYCNDIEYDLLYPYISKSLQST